MQLQMIPNRLNFQPASVRIMLPLFRAVALKKRLGRYVAGAIGFIDFDSHFQWPVGD
jgi:hypothetical protein